MSNTRKIMADLTYDAKRRTRETDVNSLEGMKSDNLPSIPSPSLCTLDPSAFGQGVMYCKESRSDRGFGSNETDASTESLASSCFLNTNLVTRTEHSPLENKYLGTLKSSKNSTEESKVPFTKAQYLSEFKKLTDQMLDLTTKKNADYGSNTDPFANFRTFGELGILVRMSDKFSRLRTALYEKREFQVNNETVEDTALDLAVYALLLISYRRGAN